MPLIGTAGHVDHGKSTLIQRLTGRDPDRWEEEKRRGLTIDLGFAWTTMPGGAEVSFVDVPGHERYLKNMLAGIEAIDVALLVVGADEGWMPQSEEHLAVLDLLGVDRGVVALTKSDLVDDDLLELAHLEIEERLAGTSLGEAAIIPVSSTTGEGVDRIVAELDRLTAAVDVPDWGWPRLWVDRSFTAPGAGTIVTGTLLDGSLAVEEEVMVYPRQLSARIRGVQSHERSHQAVGPGRRVALNLGGIDRSAVSRGDLVGKPGQWVTTERFSARLRQARYVEDFGKKGAYQLHIGSSVHPVTITGLDVGAAVMTTDRPIPMAVGDRFIIRDTGRKLVVAGGRVADPSPGPTEKTLDSAARMDLDGTPDQIAGALLAVRGGDELARLAAQTRGGRPAEGVEAGDRVIGVEAFRHLTEKANELISTEHREHPLRVGLPLATLAGQLGETTEVAEAIVERDEGLIRVGPDVAISGRAIEVDEESQSQWERARKALASDLAVPTIAELEIDPELLHFQLRQGELVRVGEDLVFLPGQIESIEETLRGMPPDFTVADFRDATGLSRKYAVPLLEWADRKGLTVRRGDTRTVR